MKVYFLMTGLIFGLSHTSISAAQTPTGSPPSFAELDLNHDGEISRDEVSNEKLLDSFFQLDQNVSGTLTPDEYPPKHHKGRGQGMQKGQGMHPSKKPSFTELDLNADGKLTLDELKGPLAREAANKSSRLSVWIKAARFMARGET
ncbi:hypothetical protein MED121_22362 [Marinomonas sp. MED121]|uniref:EF-hand domain-containing protein n=1 Tax=Marinomonas sp. MED121 TaxID=314277 RepID=UPI000068FD7C|nr:EF-hand domain-containing protein [Marinomonas sp. MED121]EAQ65462.1 hypothetical protein MED121_22362 [Marinomonas sp. MED121]